LKTRVIAANAATAAIYAGLTVALGEMGFGIFQFRPAEALALLPFLLPQTVWGLFVGCACANIVSQYGLLDMVIGSLATLLAAFLTSKCKRLRVAILPPIFINAAAVGAVIVIATPNLGWLGWPLAAAGVAFSQSLSVGFIGVPFILAVKKLNIAARWDMSA
jgi:uncharacterized membrane protein